MKQDKQTLVICLGLRTWGHLSPVFLFTFLLSNLVLEFCHLRVYNVNHMNARNGYFVPRYLCIRPIEFLKYNDKVSLQHFLTFLY